MVPCPAPYLYYQYGSEESWDPEKNKIKNQIKNKKNIKEAHFVGHEL